ncbi:MAG TPA: Gfo/Idh/MocA family oxidoreductase [Gemmatimonadales bacterium]|nr:Gfo/Idh/MocA family oxidoreductase [Gemmatimonadales bacterium]
MSGEVRIAIVGCGRAAERLHLPALARTPGARLAAVVDPRPERRALVAPAGGECRAFGSLDAMLAAGAADAVVVATPPDAHVESVRAALEAGLPALVEKPLAPTGAEAAALAALAAARNVPLAVGFNRRHWQPAERLRTVLAAMASAPAAARLVFRAEPARWDAVSGPGELLGDLASHQLDLLRFLFRREITAIRARPDGPDGFLLRVRLGHEVRAECRVARGATTEETMWISRSGIVWRLAAGSERIGPAGGSLRRALDAGDRLARRVRRRRSAMRRSYERQLEAFVAVARRLDQPTAGAADGVAVARALDAARASLAAGGAEVVLG